MREVVAHGACRRICRWGTNYHGVSRRIERGGDRERERKKEGNIASCATVNIGRRGSRKGSAGRGQTPQGVQEQPSKGVKRAAKQAGRQEVRTSG